MGTPALLSTFRPSVCSIIRRVFNIIVTNLTLQLGFSLSGTFYSYFNSTIVLAVTNYELLTLELFREGF